MSNSHTNNITNRFSLKEVGARLKKARKSLRLSTEEVSKSIGIGKISYYKYEDGSRFPKPEILNKLIDLFNLNLNYLVSGKGDMFAIRENDEQYKWEIIAKLFPEISCDAYPLIEALEIPVMKHSLMMYYLMEKEKLKGFVEDFKKKLEENKKPEPNKIVNGEIG